MTSCTFDETRPCVPIPAACRVVLMQTTDLVQRSKRVLLNTFSAVRIDLFCN
eukprot:m.206207 g.206207  ORF g.206207 m.206207 type:complete len:52 (+) comp18893_c0_seq1:344-499(+)